MAKGDDIRERLITFSVAVMRLCEELPKTPEASHIAQQLIRASTAAAANYSEARGAESPRDFVHKLGITLKELNEAETWLEIILRKEMVSTSITQPVKEECSSLCRIIAASIRTAGKKLSRRNRA